MKNGYHLIFCFTEKFTGFFIGKVSVLLFVFLSLSPFIRAQHRTDPETENRIKNDAATYFGKDDLLDAYPLYSQLLSLYPQDPVYNYRFGACILYAAADKKKAVKYIQYAVKQPSVENLAYYYLGRALHLNYEFSKAINAYEKFEQAATSSELKKYPVARFKEMCRNGEDLLALSQELDVLRKKELNASNFFRAYNMHSNGGSLISEPDDFKSKVDKDKKIANLMYVTPDRSMAFFSSYGPTDNNGRDIYMINKKTDGTWGTPQNLGNAINTSFDEDYPVYDVPRHTLYFSSKGHNSMGGYDIFASVFNDTTQSWSQPYNLDFPINTPDDDILLVPDTSGQTAFFASTRSSPQGKVDVYKIALHLHPPGSEVIAGTVYKDANKTPELAVITVRDSATNKVIAIDTTSEDGHYSFNLPPGKYNFTVDDSTHKGLSQSVVLAMQEAHEGIDQNIQFDGSGNLQIKSSITKTAKDSSSLQYIQNEAQMNVNVDTNTIQSLIAQNKASDKNIAVVSSAGRIDSITTSVTKNTNSGGGSTGYDSVNIVQLEQSEKQSNDNAAKAIDYASDQLEQAQQLQEQIHAASTNQNGASVANPDSITKWSAESKTATEKGMEAYQLASEYKAAAAAKQVLINKMEQVNSTGGTATNNQTTSNNTTASTASVSPGDLIRQQAMQVKEDSLQLAQTNDETTIEINGLQQKSVEFTKQAAQTGDPQQKAALSEQANDLLKSKAQKQEEIRENTIELAQYHNEYVWLNTKAQKADSASASSANNGKPIITNSPAQTELQNEINAYAVSNGVDTSGITGNNTAQNGNQNTANKNGTVNNPRHSRHSHLTHTGQISQSGNIVATNPQTGNLPNTNTGNQNTTLTSNNNGTSSTNASNNSTNPQSNNNSGNQNTPLTDNNNSTNSTNLTSNSTNNPQSNNNNGGNQNTPLTGNNNSTNSTNLTSNSTNNPQSNNNNGGNQNTQLASTNNGTNSTNSSNNPSSRTPDSIDYYKTSDSVVLAAIANTFQKAQTSNSIPANYSNFQGGSRISTVQYTDTASTGLTQKAQSYFAAANVLADTVQKIRSEAQTEPDKNKSALLYRKTDSLNGLIFQLNLKGNEIITEASARQYASNANEIAKISSQHNTSNRSENVIIAQNILKDANNTYKRSVLERDSANNTSSPAQKRDYTASAKKNLATALLIQQKAVHLYYQDDSIKALSARDTSNSESALRVRYSGFRKMLASENANSSSIHNSDGSNTNAVQNSASNNFSSSNNQNTGNTQTSNLENSSQNATASNNTQSGNNNTGQIDPSNNTSNALPSNIGITNNTASSGNSQTASIQNTANMFTDIRKSAYSVDRPIPIDPPLPTGIAFGVQVGAFRNSIPPNLFKGFKPIIGMKAAEGYVRYIAGLFGTFDMAKDAVGKIRNLGYPQAFIVAFYNGRRISLKDALAKLGGNTSQIAGTENQQTNTSQGTQQATQPGDTLSSSGIHEVASITENTITPSTETLIDTKRKSIRAIKDTVPPAAKSINVIKGLFYTVQVGSFSTHKGFTRLRKIKQLYTWTDEKGIIKYNSGTYGSTTDARAAKDIIIANTVVKDAFVTAYYDGKRITIAQAKNLSGNGAGSSNTNTIATASTNTSTTSTYKEVDSSSFALASQTNVIYTVRIAAFRGTLPVDTVNKLLNYSSEGVEPYKEGQDITAYYAGKFPDYAEATVLQQKFYKAGFREAAIAAYYQGKKISLQQALSITNK